jgi:hypothetical protein
MKFEEWYTVAVSQSPGANLVYANGPPSINRRWPTHRIRVEADGQRMYRDRLLRNRGTDSRVVSDVELRLAVAIDRLTGRRGVGLRRSCCRRLLVGISLVIRSRPGERD